MATQVSSGNLPIPNDTGANVLADINENLEALQSNNAGDNAPPVAKKHQWYVDTSGSTDVLKIKGNADNAAFITLGNIETNLGMMPKTGGSFTGEITTVAGTKTSPAIKLDDANTGLYEPATDTIGLTCGGNDIAYVDANGIEIKDGKKLEFRDSGGSNVVSLQAPALTSDVALTLPDNDVNEGDVVNSDAHGAMSWTAIQGVPVGTIMPYAGSETNIPPGYFECDGSQKPSTTYQNLADVCGDTYNNGQTPSAGHFFLPDLRGEFIRGWDHGRGTDVSRTRGAPQNSKNLQHTHSSSNTATTTGGTHSHDIHSLGLALRSNATHMATLMSVTGKNHITLGSGQGYAYHYSTTAPVVSGVIENSGDISTFSTTVSLTINNDPFTVTGNDESRPRNIALIYIIKH